MYPQPAPRPYSASHEWAVTDALIGAALGALIGAALAGLLPGTQPMVNGGPVAVVLLGAILGALIGAVTPRVAAAGRRPVPAYVIARPAARPAAYAPRPAPPSQRVTVVRRTAVDAPAGEDETAFAPRIVEDVQAPEPSAQRERVVIRRSAAYHEPASTFEELPGQAWEP